MNVLGEPIHTWATTTCRKYLLLLDFPAFDSNLCKAGIFLSLTAWIMSWSFTIVPKGNNSPYNVIHRKVNIATFLYTRAMPRRFYITDRNSHTISRLFLQKIKYNMPEYKEGCLSFTTNTYTYFLHRRFSHTWLECDPRRLRMRKVSQCNEVLRLEGGDVFSFIFYSSKLHIWVYLYYLWL